MKRIQENKKITFQMILSKNALVINGSAHCSINLESSTAVACKPRKVFFEKNPIQVPILNGFKLGLFSQYFIKLQLKLQTSCILGSENHMGFYSVYCCFVHCFVLEISRRNLKDETTSNVTTSFVRWLWFGIAMWYYKQFCKERYVRLA